VICSYGYQWLIPVAASATTLLIATIHYRVLLAGFLTSLPGFSQSDRPQIFREFARALSASRGHPGSAIRWR
jgi:hypothetical protein